MKKYVNGLLAAAAVGVLFGAPMSADAAWQQNTDGTYSYYSGTTRLKNRWIGDYYVDKNGCLVTNRWIGQYFVGENGKYIPRFKGGWYRIDGKVYYYLRSGKKETGLFKVKGKTYLADADGVRLSGWQEMNGGRYYFHKRSGYMLTGTWKISGEYYYFNKKTGKQQLGWYTNSLKRTYYFDLETGARKSGLCCIDGKTYYFNKDGIMQKGFVTLESDRYYFNEKGVMQTGFQKIEDSYYYFDEDGRMRTNDNVTVNGKTYSIGSDGICTIKVPNGVAVSDVMLFFTVYESGSSASSLVGYSQTGGDGGNACGKYQFDYRYALLPFIKYCYSSDPTAFKEFKTFARYTDGQKGLLQGNSKLYTAWKKIYRRNPELFKAYQDSFAKQQYYDVTERYLSSLFGISIAGRPDAVKGAVFSYAIQHGSYSAALAVKNAGIKNSTSNKTFLNKLYAYRMSQYPAYYSRYISEKNAALRLL